MPVFSVFSHRSCFLDRSLYSEIFPNISHCFRVWHSTWIQSCLSRCWFWEEHKESACCLVSCTVVHISQFSHFPFLQCKIVVMFIPNSTFSTLALWSFSKYLRPNSLIPFHTCAVGYICLAVIPFTCPYCKAIFLPQNTLQSLRHNWISVPLLKIFTVSPSVWHLQI